MYKVIRTNGEEQFIDNPAQLPSPGVIEALQEPFLRATILAPNEYVGNIMKLCMDRRENLKNQTYLSQVRVDLEYELPLSEVVFNFYDKLKSLSHGYASLDYELLDYRTEDLVKLDILLNSEQVDALSSIIHRSKSFDWGRKLCSRLKELIPGKCLK